MTEEKALNIGPSKIDIAYQRLGELDAPPVLLMMGAGAQMIAWHDGFCAELVKRNLQVIRFDNRDTGLTTHFSNAPIPDFQAVMKGDFSTVSYSLSDMAADTIGLIDFLGFEQMHLVGASMGGMIAQTVAIEYPSRVKSLTSIMSTTGNPSVGQPDFAALATIGKPNYDNREEYIQWRINSLKIIGSPYYPFDEEAAIQNTGLSWDRDHDPLAMVRQLVAVLKSGDRTSLLKKLQMPTLVLHGKLDKMIHVSGGIATAEAIPNSKLVLFEHMGHGLPKPLWSEFADLISERSRTAIG
ncbi:MAG: alpha/beta fold hydrolase [Chitinophagaceae bacterium]|nr:alpha/beta fold hydrolase [Chitinophagaceae bacterium]